jgi:hypothetical protein
MPVEVAVTLAVPHAPGRDLVFSVPFALAWQKLKERIGPVRMEPQPPLADALNELTLDANIIDPAWCVAQAGFGGEGILEAIRAELAAKLPLAKPRQLPPSLPPDALFAYGYLSKDLRFRTVFAPQKVGFAGYRVRAFGLADNPYGADRERMAQIVVHDCVSPVEFVIELLAEDPSDCRILIAQIPPQETLGATVRDALHRLDRIEGDPRSVHQGEKVAIPRLELDVAQTFDEVIGRPLSNDAARGTSFDDAMQQVCFKLDEGGASVTAEASLGSFGLPPRSFYVTQPFLVMLLRRASSEPFLALWVETTEWMQVLEKLPPGPATPMGSPPFGPPPFGPPPFGPPPVPPEFGTRSTTRPASSRC